MGLASREQIQHDGKKERLGVLRQFFGGVNALVRDANLDIRMYVFVVRLEFAKQA